MVLYGIGVVATPHIGATAWINTNTFITPPMAALAFLFGGVYILLLNPSPAFFSLCTLPILLYALASFLRLLSVGAELSASTATIAHFGMWLIIMSVLYERTRAPAPTTPTQEL